MWNSKRNVSLSPKLKWGVGRGTFKNKFLKTGGVICLITAVVLGGNALYLIFSGQYGEVYSLNGPQVLGATTGTTPAETKPYKDYTVQTGDTLFNISQRINVPWTTLAELNKLKTPFSLKPGQVIKIPSNE